MAENAPERESPPTRPPVGSVAEETARLLDALLAGTGASGQDEVSAAAYPTDTTDRPPKASAEAEPCPTCGQVPGAGHTTADGAVCQLCPVCQLLRVVRTVRPETLRDVAASRWQESGSPPPRRARPEVEDIQVDGEEGR
jgi:hypothetical protein